MKHLLFLAFIAILMPACQKDGNVEEENETGAPVTSASLSGKWELRSIHGNISNCCNYPPGNGDILKFNGNQYEKYEKNVLKKKGAFMIMADTTVAVNTCLTLLAASFPNRIIYDSNFANPKIFFAIKNGKLTFVSGCYAADAGHSDTYEPVQ